ncbi:MAG: class I SAM-dependent methyltransferase [Terriglobia bacterium]
MSAVGTFVFEHTPKPFRNVLRRVKYYALGKLSGRAYWNFASRVSATAAILTDCTNEEEFFQSGRYQAKSLEALGLLGPQARVLDIGCGIGRVENSICQMVESVLGVDISDHMIEKAREKVKASNVRFQRVDGSSLNGIPSNAFDSCFSFFVFQHIPRASVASYFREVCQVLKPGGRFLFQMQIAEDSARRDPPADHPFGVRLYRVSEVEGLLTGAGFEVGGRYDQAGALLETIPKVMPDNNVLFLARRPV